MWFCTLVLLAVVNTIQIGWGNGLKMEEESFRKSQEKLITLHLPTAKVMKDRIIQQRKDSKRVFDDDPNQKQAQMANKFIESSNSLFNCKTHGFQSHTQLKRESTAFQNRVNFVGSSSYQQNYEEETKHGDFLDFDDFGPTSKKFKRSQCPITCVMPTADSLVCSHNNIVYKIQLPANLLSPDDIGKIVGGIYENVEGKRSERKVRRTETSKQDLVKALLLKALLDKPWDKQVLPTKESTYEVEKSPRNMSPQEKWISLLRPTQLTTTTVNETEEKRKNWITLLAQNSLSPEADNEGNLLRSKIDQNFLVNVTMSKDTDLDEGVHRLPIEFLPSLNEMSNYTSRWLSKRGMKRMRRRRDQVQCTTDACDDSGCLGHKCRRPLCPCETTGCFDFTTCSTACSNFCSTACTPVICELDTIPLVHKRSPFSRKNGMLKTLAWKLRSHGGENKRTSDMTLSQINSPLKTTIFSGTRIAFSTLGHQPTVPPHLRINTVPGSAPKLHRSFPHRKRLRKRKLNDFHRPGVIGNKK